MTNDVEFMVHDYVALMAEGPDRVRRIPKNTKKWCKGKVGVEHVTELVVPDNAINKVCDVGARWTSTFTWEIGCHHVEQCVNCGKHVRHFLNKGECPTRTDDRWVD